MTYLASPFAVAVGVAVSLLVGCGGQIAEDALAQPDGVAPPAVTTTSTSEPTPTTTSTAAPTAPSATTRPAECSGAECPPPEEDAGCSPWLAAECAADAWCRPRFDVFGRYEGAECVSRALDDSLCGPDRVAADVTLTPSGPMVGCFALCATDAGDPLCAPLCEVGLGCDEPALDAVGVRIPEPRTADCDPLAQAGCGAGEACVIVQPVLADAAGEPVVSDEPAWPACLTDEVELWGCAPGQIWIDRFLGATTPNSSFPGCFDLCVADAWACPSLCEARGHCAEELSGLGIAVFFGG